MALDFSASNVNGYQNEQIYDSRVGGGVMVLFCADLTCKEEVKAMVIGT